MSMEDDIGEIADEFACMQGCQALELGVDAEVVENAHDALERVGGVAGLLGQTGFIFAASFIYEEEDTHPLTIEEGKV